MKKTSLFTVFVIIFFLLQPVHLAAGNDKLKHFGISLVFGTAGESILHYTTEWKDAALIGWGTALGILPGLMKEIIDSSRKDNHFSGLDLAADFAGALCGAVFSNLVNNRIQFLIESEKERRRFAFILRYTF